MTPAVQSQATSVESLVAEVDRLLHTDLPAARRVAEQAIQIAEPVGGAALAVAQRSLAHVYRVLGQQEQALDLYDQARAGFEAAGDPVQAARTAIGQINSLAYLGQYESALTIGAAAYETLLAHGEDYRAANLDFNLGNIYARLDDPRRALAHFDRARGVFARLNVVDGLIDADMNRANMLTNLYRFDEALALYQATAEQAHRLKLPLFAALCEYNLAYLYTLRGEYQAALSLLDRVEPIFLEMDFQPLTGLCQLDRAEILLCLNRFEEAYEQAEQARQRFLGLKQGYEAAKAAAFTGRALEGLGQSEKALDRLEMACVEFETEGNAVWLAECALDQAGLLLASGETDQALSLATQAATTFQSRNLQARQAAAYIQAGRIQLAAQQSREAFELSHRALSLLRPLDTPALCYQAHHLAGRAAMDCGKTRIAYRHYQRALADMEAMRASLQEDEYRISFFEDKQKVYEELFLLSAQSADPAKVAEAFRYVEKAKSRALVDLLARSVAVRPHAGNDELTQRLTELRREISASDHQQAQQETRRGLSQPEVPEYRTRTRILESELRDVLHRLSEHDREYVSLQTVETVDAGRVQQVLPAGYVLVEYYRAGNQIQAFVIRPDGLSLHRDLASHEEVAGLFAYFRLLLAKFSLGRDYVAGHQNQLASLARIYLGRLYDHLVRPFEAEIRGQSVIVVPHGLLHYLPFHALYTGKGYWIEETEIRYAPSATVFDFCHSRPAIEYGPALLLGVDDQTIPHAVHEATTIGRLLPNATVCVGDQATAESLRQFGTNSRLIHIASHGEFRPDSPLLSGVHLADGWLTLGEVYTLQVNAALVTLSASQTGVSQVTNGDELIGLTRGFLYAGAASLIVSLWTVADESTAALMSDFYTAWQAGQPVATALRAAQLAALDREGHPYFWAPFALIG